jgi:hypothetical protein
MGKKSGSGSGIRDEQPGSYFLELRNHFVRVKILNSLMRIRDPGWKNSGLGSGMEKSRIRDWEKYPGSATLVTMFPFPEPVCTVVTKKKAAAKIDRD